MKIFDPENTESGEYLYTFMSQQADGKMGIMGIHLPNGDNLPAVFLGKHLIEFMKPLVKNVAKMTDKEVKLCRYKLDEIMETIEK